MTPEQIKEARELVSDLISAYKPFPKYDKDIRALQTLLQVAEKYENIRTLLKSKMPKYKVDYTTIHDGKECEEIGIGFNECLDQVNKIIDEVLK